MTYLPFYKHEHAALFIKAFIKWKRRAHGISLVTVGAHVYEVTWERSKLEERMDSNYLQYEFGDFVDHWIQEQQKIMKRS